MKLCMFSPLDRDLQRGWPGPHRRRPRRAARGADAAGVLHRRRRARASTPCIALDDVVLRAPVLHPPSVRIFDGDDFVVRESAAHLRAGRAGCRCRAAPRRSRRSCAWRRSIGAAIDRRLHAHERLARAGARGRSRATSRSRSARRRDAGRVRRWRRRLGRRSSSMPSTNTRLLPGDIVAGPVSGAGRSRRETPSSSRSTTSACFATRSRRPPCDAGRRRRCRRDGLRSGVGAARARRRRDATSSSSRARGAARATAARGSSASRTPRRTGCSSPQEALDGWRELERDSGRRLLGLHGLVELARDVGGAPRATCSTAQRDRAIAAHATTRRVRTASRCRRAGSRSGSPTPASSVPISRSQASSRRTCRSASRRVESLDDVDADVVVVTAGAWVTKLVPDVPFASRARRSRTSRRTARRRRRSSSSTTRRAHHAMYALHDPVHGVKAGAHHAGHVADPDDGRRARPAARRADRRLGRRAASRRRPGAGRGGVLPLHDRPTTSRFVLERRGRLVIGSACSGHGFKFAPAIGRRLADLALG